MIAYEDKMRKGGGAAIEEASRFLMGEGPVHHSLHKLAKRLQDLGVPYAIAGGMSLVAHGYDRTTVDIDVLVDADGLVKIQEVFKGLGYVPPFTGSKSLRDAETSVRIEFLVSGQYPGDGKPKPVAFPDPRDASVEIRGIRYLTLPRLVELKLASGMTNAGRLKDLADVQELIRVLRLPREFGSQLNAYVRAKYEELWDAVAQSPSEP